MNLKLYEDMLKETAKYYNFGLINCSLDIVNIFEKSISTCFLRHDIDFSPLNALRMAELEHELGVQSTFTVLLSGQFYNPFEKENRKLLKQILSFGHEIGLHFDASVYEIKKEAVLLNHLAKEASALEDLLEKKISMFSFHNTTEFSMSCREFKYCGLINAYSDFFQDKVEYTSDSNGYWRFRSWIELLKEKYKVIQILTHPSWWLPNNNYPPFETILKIIIERADSSVSEYINTFEGQNLRTNLSYLTDLMAKHNKTNKSDILNSYAKSPDLLRLLRTGNEDEFISKLNKISETLGLK
jgi:hypothetical protein